MRPDLIPHLTLTIALTLSLAGCGEDGGGSPSPADGWPCSISSADGTWTYERHTLIEGEAWSIEAWHTDGSSLSVLCAPDCTDAKITLPSGHGVSYRIIERAPDDDLEGVSDLNVMGFGPAPVPILPVNGRPGVVRVKETPGGVPREQPYVSPSPCERCTIDYGCGF